MRYTAKIQITDIQVVEVEANSIDEARQMIEDDDNCRVIKEYHGEYEIVPNSLLEIKD